MIAKIDTETCIRCKACMDACPVDAIIISSEEIKVEENCIACGNCISVCPVDAIHL